VGDLIRYPDQPPEQDGEAYDLTARRREQQIEQIR
jgi:hypothetical protein